MNQYIDFLIIVSVILPLLACSFYYAMKMNIKKYTWEEFKTACASFWLSTAMVGGVYQLITGVVLY